MFFLEELVDNSVTCCVILKIYYIYVNLHIEFNSSKR
jgi:hypothetical protein